MPKPVSAARVASVASAVLFLLSGCAGDPSPVQPSGVVELILGERRVQLFGGSCTWYENSGQLFVEAGDPDGQAYLLLGAPLEWLGDELPEGPGNEPELSLRVDGSERAVEQQSLHGTMVAAQTAGTFTGRLADGTPIAGSWTCSEVVDE